jgi:alpha-tubulin suppressor-like RCC1 family protein
LKQGVATEIVGVRPVINLAPNVRLLAGDGSYDPAASAWSPTSGPWRLLGQAEVVAGKTRLNKRFSGEFVRIGQHNYRISEVMTDGGVRVILDEVVKEAGSDKLGQFSNVSGASGAVFDPKMAGNVANYLDQVVFDDLFPTPVASASGQDSVLVRQQATYFQGNRQNTAANVLTQSLANTDQVTARIALPRVGEIMAAPTERTQIGNYWTMTRSTQSNQIYQIKSDAAALNNVGNAPGDTALLRPVVTVKRPAVIKQGLGTIAEPFELEVYRPTIDPLYTTKVDLFYGSNTPLIDLVTASDMHERDLTTSVTYTSVPAFDPRKSGTYRVTYEVTDADGVAALPLEVEVTVWKFIKIDFGWYHSIALTSHGQVYTWGYNNNGQIGDGTLISRATPHRVNGNLQGVEVVDVAAGVFSSYAVTAAGELYTWGDGAEGALGTGNINDQYLPVALKMPAGVKFTQVSIFNQTVTALTDTGQLYIWGDGIYGALGTGNTNDLLTPQLMSGISNVAVMAMGEYHGVVYTHDGQICAWGNNSYGQQGLGSINNVNDYFKPHCRPSFAPIKQLAAAHDFSLALTETGEVYAWGRGQNYRLGTGNDSNATTPTLLNITGVAQIANGSYHSLLVTETGEMYGVGSNAYGKLGLGHSIDPQRTWVRNQFFDSQQQRTAVIAAGGFDASCVLTAESQIYCFGYGGDGGLGNGVSVTQYSPQKVISPSTLPENATRD